MRRMSDDHLASSVSPPAEARPRRRWYQFGLRTLFLLTTVIVGLLAVWRVYAEPYRRQHEAMEVIKRLGGTFETREATAWQRRLFGEDHHDLTLVNLADCDRVEEYLPHVARLPCLETLIVGGEQFRGEHLRRLESPTLHTLILDSTPVSPDALAEWLGQTSSAQAYRSQRRAIAALENIGLDVMTEPSDARRTFSPLLPAEMFAEACRVGDPPTSRGSSWPGVPLSFKRQAPAGGSVPPAARPLPIYSRSGEALTPLRHLGTLRWLYLTHGHVGDDALGHVKDLAQLETLHLTNSAVGDAGLASVQNLSRLRWLYLSGTRVGDAGLAHLRQLTRLAWLELDGTQVGDQGLAHLQGLNIEYLSLRSTRVTDGGLAHLAEAKRLNQLRLVGTQVTREAVDRFRKARPNCFVQDEFDVFGQSRSLFQDR
jgi:hypothetical protein